MPKRAFTFYQRHRIVNVNLNIIGAGLLAIALSKLPVLWVTSWIGPEHKLINSLVAAIIDGVVDIALYYMLHWVANHWRPVKVASHDHEPDESFWKNATLVQFERIALTPAFYIIAIGGMWGLQHLGMQASWAFVIAFAGAILCTRIVHTMWGLWSGRFEPIPLDEFRFRRSKTPADSAHDDACDDDTDPHTS